MQNAVSKSQIAAVSSTQNRPAGDHDSSRVNRAPGAVCNGRPRKLSAEQDAALLALVNGTVRLTDPEIATAMDLGVGTIKHALRRLRKSGAEIERVPWTPAPLPPLPPDDPMFGVSDDWSAKMIVQLRGLWSDLSLVATEIGRRLGVSKNAIVGKAHRLGLPSRPSPINFRDIDAPPRPTRAPRLTLPPLPSGLAPADDPPTSAPLTAMVTADRQSPPVRVTAEYDRGLATVPLTGPTPRVPPARPAPRVTYVAPYLGRVTECCWPMGEPGTRQFRFCDASSKPGRPYCQEHVNAAYSASRPPSPAAGSGAALSGAP